MPARVYLKGSKASVAKDPVMIVSGTSLNSGFRILEVDRSTQCSFIVCFFFADGQSE